MRKISWWVAVGILLAGCAGVVSPPSTTVPSVTRALPPEATATTAPTPLATLESTPASVRTLGDQEAALLDDFKGDISVLTGATVYSIVAEVEFDGQASATISGTARIQVTNPGPDALPDLALMLWPNNDQYRGSIRVQPALVDGRLEAGQPELGGLAMRYRLAKPLPAGGVLDITVPFTVRAEGPIGGQTPYRFGISEGVLFAPTFYPMVPRIIDGEWEVRDAPPGGDTTNSVVSAYRVRLTVPDDLRLIATGVESGRRPAGEGRVEVDYVSGPVRDFAFALGDLMTESDVVDSVQINTWTLPTHRLDQDRVLSAASRQVELLDELVGPYPYTELDVIDVPGAYGGIEYPGLVSIGTLGTSWVIEPVVHEVAHQWFYGLIGDDQLDEPWMDEAFATYATALYYENAVDPGTATGYLSDFRDVVRSAADPGTPIGMGVGSYVGREYSVFVYLKGALFYQELRQQLGDDVFFEFLHQFFEQYRYRVASAAEFQAAAEAACSCQLDALFDLWVYEGGASAIP
jgi:hypothetical protein